MLSEYGVFLRAQTLSFALTRAHKNDPPISEAQRIERMLNIANEVIGICKLWKVRHVGIEGYAMDARFQAHQIGEVAGTLKTQLYLALRLVPRIVPPNSGRKHVMGFGTPTKEEIVNVVRDGLGYDVRTDHEADAGVVARFVFDKQVVEEKELGL